MLTLQIQNLQMQAAQVAEQVQKERTEYYKLISNIVRIAQRYRLQSEFQVSDSLRAALAESGIEVVQGTAGYTYPEIPEALKGRPIADTWKIKS